MAQVWYANREEVKGALDSKETARNNLLIDRAISASTAWIEDFLGRKFYPTQATRVFDWPDHADPRDGTRAVPLGRDELISCTQLTVNGVVIDPAHYTLRTVGTGPAVAVDLDSTVTLTGNPRRAVLITGLYGYTADEEQVGTLGATLAAGAAATASVSWTTARFGVGDLLRIDSERLIITSRSMVDSTQNLGGPGLTNAMNDVTVPVTAGAGYAVDEIILIDSERMLVVDIAGNNLTVKRSWDGSVLATHATSADIFTLTGVELARGQAGTSDASHTSSTPIYRHLVPPLVKQLCVAEAAVTLLQQASGYGRKIGSGDNERPSPGEGLEDLRRRAWEAHGRSWSGSTTSNRGA